VPIPCWFCPLFRQHETLFRDPLCYTTTLMGFSFHFVQFSTSQRWNLLKVHVKFYLCFGGTVRNSMRYHYYYKYKMKYIFCDLLNTNKIVLFIIFDTHFKICDCIYNLINLTFIKWNFSLDILIYFNNYIKLPCHSFNKYITIFKF